jgi:heterotetrameric sarcosine oxidase delta subunit
MLLIPCPCCGPRAEDEFAYGGDASIERPRHPSEGSDAEWLRYLYMRPNPRGRHMEWWFHQSGCGSWFRIVRNTVDHRIAPAPHEA